MIEFDVDMNYLLECDELDKVVLNDENGEHEPMEFAPIAATTNPHGTCEGEIDTDSFECRLTWFECKGCGWSGVVDNVRAGYSFDGTDMPRHCPNCGKKIEVSE